MLKKYGKDSAEFLKGLNPAEALEKLSALRSKMSTADQIDLDKALLA